jgi:hypothetical protein
VAEARVRVRLISGLNASGQALNATILGQLK